MYNLMLKFKKIKKKVVSYFNDRKLDTTPFTTKNKPDFLLRFLR